MSANGELEPLFDQGEWVMDAGSLVQHGLAALENISSLDVTLSTKLTRAMNVAEQLTTASKKIYYGSIVRCLGTYYDPVINDYGGVIGYRVIKDEEVEGVALGFKAMIVYEKDEAGNLKEGTEKIQIGHSIAPREDIDLTHEFGTTTGQLCAFAPLEFSVLQCGQEMERYRTVDAENVLQSDTVLFEQVEAAIASKFDAKVLAQIIEKAQQEGISKNRLEDIVTYINAMTMCDNGTTLAEITADIICTPNAQGELTVQPLPFSVMADCLGFILGNTYEGDSETEGEKQQKRELYIALEITDKTTGTKSIKLISARNIDSCEFSD